MTQAKLSQNLGFSTTAPDILDWMVLGGGGQEGWHCALWDV